MPAKRQIYFSITPTNAGFTDQMLQFATLYRLGRSLDFTYIHVPFASHRSSALPRKVLTNAASAALGGFSWKQRLRRWRKRIDAITGGDVYRFLGFNDCLSAISASPRSKEITRVPLTLSDAILKEHGVVTFSQLQSFVARSIEQRSLPSDTVVAQFKLSGRKQFFALINDNTPDYHDGLDLRAAYFQARQRRPWPSRYEAGTVKICMHVRQGDTAVLETPWGTFIPLYRVKNQYTEHQSFADIESTATELLHVDSYRWFLEQLMTLPEAAACSALVFSDGYARAFARFYKNIERAGLSADQVHALAASEKSYDRLVFDKFGDIRGATLIVGEESGNLCDLIHSVLLADVVIIGPQQKMIPKFLANYCDAQNMPTVVVLYRGKRPAYNTVDLSERAKSFVYFDVDHDDVRPLATKLISRQS